MATAQPQREDREILSDVHKAFSRLAEILREASAAKIMVDVKLTVVDDWTPMQAPRPSFKVRAFKVV